MRSLRKSALMCVVAAMILVGSNVSLACGSGGCPGKSGMAGKGKGYGGGYSKVAGMAGGKGMGKSTGGGFGKASAGFGGGAKFAGAGNVSKP